jgi:hypothetical protein
MNVAVPHPVKSKHVQRRNLFFVVDLPTARMSEALTKDIVVWEHFSSPAFLKPNPEKPPTSVYCTCSSTEEGDEAGPSRTGAFDWLGY